MSTFADRVNRFYRDFFITSLSPLGFLTRSTKGNWVNCNYYDREDLFQAVRPFIERTIRQQIAFGVDTRTCYVMGKKHARYVDLINREERLFGSLVALDHPRYIEQYRSKSRDHYISAYLKQLLPAGS